MKPIWSWTYKIQNPERKLEQSNPALDDWIDREHSRELLNKYQKMSSEDIF